MRAYGLLVLLAASSLNCSADPAQSLAPDGGGIAPDGSGVTLDGGGVALDGGHALDAGGPLDASGPPPPDGAAAPNPNPNLGVNLEGLADTSRSAMFADLMLTSRKFGSVASPWDESAAVDANGWPTQDAGVVVSIQGPNNQDPGGPYLVAGTYSLSFTGKATVGLAANVNIKVQNYVYNASTNTSTADVVVPANENQINLTFTQTSGGVQNVRLLRPGYKGTSKVFTDEFIAALAPFSTLRCMDILATNGNPVQHWTDRTTLMSARQSGRNGVAWEYIIQLANLTGKDIWINIPAGADDNYITQLATLLKSTLNAGIHVYVEFSNELWNYTFTQTSDNANAAVAEAIAGDTSLTEGQACTAADFMAGTCNKGWAAYRRVAKMIARVSNLFGQVYGASAINTTIRPVLASQFGYWAIPEGQLLYLKNYKGAPNTLIYALAGAPYYFLDQATSTSTTLTLDQIFASFLQYLQKNILPYFAAGSSVNGAFMKGTPYNGGKYTGASYKALADYYGIKSFAYEGGMDYKQNSVSLPVKYQSNFDSRTGDQLKTYLGQWYGCKNDLFMYYSLASAYGQWGDWGLTNDIYNLNTPKMNAMVSIANTPLSSFTTCN